MNNDAKEARIVVREGANIVLKPKILEVRPPKVLRLDEFMKLKFPKYSPLLAPWLERQSLVMIYGPRGVGKTYAVLEMALAIAAGASFLGWQAKIPNPIVYLDGEMAAGVMQRRLRHMLKSPGIEESAVNFYLITPDCQDGLLPDLSTPEGQAYIDKVTPRDAAVIFIDNLSAWCRSGREDAEAWNSVAAWALRKRSEGKSVVFVHHSGKSGAQRGTSKREDFLDVVINLKLPDGYTPDKGAYFEIHFEKARNLFGEAVAPIRARLLKTEDGRRIWKHKMLPAAGALLRKIVRLANAEMSQADIARKLRVNRSTVSRNIRKAREKGLLKGNK